MLDIIRKHNAYIEVLDKIKLGVPLSCLSLSRATRLPVLSALAIDLNVPILMITDKSDKALIMMDELGFWLPDHPRYHFSEPTPLFYEPAAWGAVTRRDRLQALTALAVNHLPGEKKLLFPPVIVTSLRALMTRTLPRRDFLVNSKTIRVNQTVNPEELLKHWVGIGYEAVDTVVDFGQFSKRGGILDVWTPAELFPARLEFFGNEVDTLRQFDPTSQRTIQNLEELLITPAREYLPAKANDLLPEGINIDEFYLPLVHRMSSSILDYLPKNALILVDDVGNIRSFAEELEEQAVKLRQESIDDGILPPDFPVPYLTWSELSDSIQSSRWIELGRSTSDEPSNLAESFSPGDRFGGHLKPFMEALDQDLLDGIQTLVVSRQLSRLKELWDEQRVGIDEGRQPTFREGSLSEGWVLSESGKPIVQLITDSEIFGWERPQPRPRLKTAHQTPEATFNDLNPGDWVVHVDFGVGRFSGLVRRTLEGIEREFLCVEYSNGDQLFVPIHQADRLSRYIGPEGSAPQPSHLGSPEWAQTKQNVREAVIQIAQDLLELYAKRESAKGFAFKSDTTWQQELEASFPYIETEDQMRAINEVKRDMEKAKPMDRLLCGDVGYGKTEVALRAAFKAVMNDKQVAILVPTTVLAQQHYETFKQRLSAYPVTVEMLSRFRSPKEQDAIVAKLARGEIDIIIGTHRLLTSDVIFRDLGLVIIDEEQRFGVTHKEHFKKLRTEVDVLTLTATPIPRTLYMALTGVRDISIINTPPAERLPIITHIGPYSPKLVKQAIYREIERGGQVFFLHNRVTTIYAMKSHIESLAPDARIGIAHGQMVEGELSKVMSQFSRGEIDVLLCTSIIESGLDIPNANTLIVDRGDTFGLAQLYQLRGRVGRGTQRAYAYFFKHRKKAPTIEGQERLETIAENTQLGAGYSIAMRDLEMRGAGEMLGIRQSGYIASVGFHLYARMLSQAVSELKKTTTFLDSHVEKAFGISAAYVPVSVDLPLAVGLPADYVDDMTLRLQLYRRMATLHDETELEALAEEFVDRFGPFTEPVENLLYQIRVKLRAEKAGLSSVAVEGDQIVLRYPPLPGGVTSRELQFVHPSARAGKNAYWMQFDETGTSWKQELLAVISEIINSSTTK
ncbi:MAG: transcription-repair coupling factor [Anaerolineaceae bacterium]